MKKHLLVLLIAHLLLQMVASHAMDESSADLLALNCFTKNPSLPPELRQQITVAAEQRNLRNKIDRLPLDMQRKVYNRWLSKEQKSSYDAAHFFLLRALCRTYNNKRGSISAADYSPSKRFLAVAESFSHTVIYEPTTMREIKRSRTEGLTFSLLFNPQDDARLLVLTSDIKEPRAQLMRFYPDNSRYSCRTDHRDLPLRTTDPEKVNAAAWHPDGKDSTYATNNMLYTFNRKTDRVTSYTDGSDLKKDESVCGIHIDNSSSTIVTKRERIYNSSPNADIMAIDEHFSTEVSLYRTTAEARNRKTTITIPGLYNLQQENPFLFCDQGRKIVLLPSHLERKKRATVYDTTTGQELFVLASKSPITTVCALPESSLLITASVEPHTGGPSIRLKTEIFILSLDPDKGLITLWETKDNSPKQFFTFPVTNSVPLLKVNPDKDRLLIAQAHGFSIFSIPALLRMHRKLSHLTLAQAELLEGFHEAIRTTSRINANQKQWDDFREMPPSFQDVLMRHIRPQRDVIDIVKGSSKKEEGISLIVKKLIEYAHQTAIQEEKEHIDRTFREEKLLEAFERAVTMPGTIHANREQCDMFRGLSAQFQQIMLGYIAKKTGVEDRTDAVS